VGGQKGLEIGVGNPHHPVEVVGNEQLLFYPPTNRAFAAFNGLGDLRDCVEFRRRFWLIGFHCSSLNFNVVASRPVAAFFDFENTAELVAAVKRGEAPPPSAIRKKGKDAEPVWSRAHLEDFSAPSIAALENGTEVENLESLV
jgi:hypothetical protein